MLVYCTGADYTEWSSLWKRNTNNVLNSLRNVNNNLYSCLLPELHKNSALFLAVWIKEHMQSETLELQVVQYNGKGHSHSIGVYSYLLSLLPVRLVTSCCILASHLSVWDTVPTT